MTTTCEPRLWSKGLRLATFQVLLAAMTTASAVPIVSVDTDPATVGVQNALTVMAGDTFTIDIVIEGVEAALPLNAFELDLDFDSAILNATSVVDGGFLLSPIFEIENVIGIGTVEFAETTLLPAGATGSGALASITFDAVAVGTSQLDLNDVLLSAPFSAPIAFSGPNDGSVTVRAATVDAPEPATIALLSLGIAGISLNRRRKRER